MTRRVNLCCSTSRNAFLFDQANVDILFSSNRLWREIHAILRNLYREQLEGPIIRPWEPINLSQRDRHTFR